MALPSHSELCDLLVGVLSCFKIPVSLSFSCSLLPSILKFQTLPDEQFLKENRETFLLGVIGSDLKITLRKKTNSKVLSDARVTKLCSVIERDLRKVEILKEENRNEILFEDLMKFNSNKRTINMIFILRNSHAFQLFWQDYQTFVRFVDENGFTVEMGDEGIFELLKSKSFDDIAMRCVQSLLRCFAGPLKRSSIQHCYSYSKVNLAGFSLPSGYGNIFNHIFLSIQLSSEYRNSNPWEMNEINLTDTRLRSRHELTSDRCQAYSPKVSESSSSRKNVLSDRVHNAIELSESLIIVGDNAEKPPVLFHTTPNESDDARLLILNKLKQAIRKEIQENK